MGVGEAGGGEDGAALDAGLEALFLEGEALEVGEGEAVGGALRGGLLVFGAMVDVVECGRT